MFEARWGPLKGAVSAQKALQGLGDRDEGVAGRNGREYCFPNVELSLICHLSKFMNFYLNGPGPPMFDCSCPPYHTIILTGCHTMEVTRALYECTTARSIKSSATLLHGSKIASILYTTLNWILKKTETNDVDNTQKCLLPTLILAYNRMTTAVQGDCTKTFTVKLSQVITDAWKQGKTNYAKLVNALFENSCHLLIPD